MVWLRMGATVALLIATFVLLFQALRIIYLSTTGRSTGSRGQNGIQAIWRAALAFVLIRLSELMMPK